MTSYQRQKRRADYYRQCVGELEELARAIVRLNPGVCIPLTGQGIGGDTIMTPYNTGSFALDLTMISQVGPREMRDPLLAMG